MQHQTPDTSQWPFQLPYVELVKGIVSGLIGYRKSCLHGDVGELKETVGFWGVGQAHTTENSARKWGP